MGARLRHVRRLGDEATRPAAAHHGRPRDLVDLHALARDPEERQEEQKDDRDRRPLPDLAPQRQFAGHWPEPITPGEPGGSAGESNSPGRGFHRASAVLKTATLT